MKERHVSIVIFYDTDGKILLQERGSHSKFGEEWGFFGGSIDGDETKEETLKREIKEELNFEIKDFEFIGTFEFEPLGDFLEVTAEAFISPVPKLEELKLNEGKSMKIFNIKETKNLKMIPEDHDIIKKVENILISRKILGE